MVLTGIKKSVGVERTDGYRLGQTAKKPHLDVHMARLILPPAAPDRVGGMI